jgi:hypothetical protein
MGALSQSPKDFFNMAQQSLFPKLTLFRVWLAFLWEDAPMEVWVFRNYLDECYSILPEVSSFRDFLKQIGTFSTGPARVHIDHHSECDLTPRPRPCKIRVVFQLPVQY